MRSSDHEQGSTAPDDEWNLQFLAELARMLAARPGLEVGYPDDPGYRVDKLALVGGNVTLVWSFPDITNAQGSPVRAGRFMNAAELRAGFTLDGPGDVAEAMVLNDFYPPYPPSEDREPSDGIRWLGPPPPAE